MNILKILSVCALGVSLQGCGTIGPWINNGWVSLFGTEYELAGGYDANSYDICGRSRCKPGQEGTIPLQLSLTTYNIQRENAVTPVEPEEAARQIIGRTIDSVSKDERPTWCTAQGTAFQDQRIVPLGPPTQFTLEQGRELTINAHATASADISSLRAAGLDLSPTEWASLEARIQSTYESLSKETIEVTGQYYEYAVDRDEIDLFLFGSIEAECAAKLQEYRNRMLIVAVGLVYYDYLFESNSNSDAFANIETDLKNQGISYDFGASIRSTVVDSLNRELTGGSEVISIGYLQARHLRN